MLLWHGEAEMALHELLQFLGHEDGVLDPGPDERQLSWQLAGYEVLLYCGGFDAGVVVGGGELYVYSSSVCCCCCVAPRWESCW